MTNKSHLTWSIRAGRTRTCTEPHRTTQAHLLQVPSRKAKAAGKVLVYAGFGDRQGPAAATPFLPSHFPPSARALLSLALGPYASSTYAAQALCVAQGIGGHGHTHPSKARCPEPGTQSRYNKNLLVRSCQQQQFYMNEREMKWGSTMGSCVRDAFSIKNKAQESILSRTCLLRTHFVSFHYFCI